MSLVTVAGAQSRNVGSGLSDSALQDVIDAAEAWLAREIGPLSGERTETFYPRRGYEPLYLRRTTDSVVVENNGSAVDLGEDSGDFRLLYGGSVVDLVGTAWDWNATTGPVTITYTPNDEILVKEAVIGLIRLNQAEGPYISERIGDYSYQKSQAGNSMDTARRAIVQSLLPRRPHRSERIIASTHP